MANYEQWRETAICLAEETVQSYGGAIAVSDRTETTLHASFNRYETAASAASYLVSCATEYPNQVSC